MSYELNIIKTKGTNLCPLGRFLQTGCKDYEPFKCLIFCKKDSYDEKYNDIVGHIKNLKIKISVLKKQIEQLENEIIRTKLLLKNI